MAFPNVYTHRKVADTKAKSCDICYKLSTSVLITADNKDWFYVCPAHLKDTGFCTPKIDHAAIEARRKRELDEEVERVKREYEEKQKKKKEKEAKGDKKDEAEDKKEKDDKDRAKTQDTTDQVRTSNSPIAKDDATTLPAEEEEEPRVFELKSNGSTKRQLEIAKRNRERMQDPTFFPSVPKSLP
ncbi:hypothetical protein NEMBOFW57_009220 [Staphylotrichum longicolle]|uniref:DUF1742-domain-containing protein n=1 Tax=Staphylotrichum longicolle TaxID=669026 RepID=A0AAD4EP42_9PEZI|nr:hypothetical protein NEMBOFW57_009220 [Staphylotrichum longicolle]